ncbi:ubiquitin carboxyl-terminal hydrolase 5 [Chironomus tepperi]|uniref:ubiquitin carboxyl-terminal hydrolase 5 n=1 Tax=Chironomus tepperi TaxID=113505 RepID=UPI00391FB2B1
MEILNENLKQIKIPTSNDNIYSEECVFSYDTPESENGLYISLTSFLSFGKDYVERYYQKTKNAVFLHIKRTKTEIPQNDSEEGPEKKITRLAIGLEGGLQDNSAKKYNYEDNYQIVVFPSQTKYPFPNDNLPAIVVESVNAIITSDSAFKKLEKEQLTGTWDGEMRQVSACALDLQQLENGKKIPPTGWKCEKCDLTNNLWLNLTDGSIMCGRRFFDGSGGNDHAVHHYQETKYPLAVKLGTITADGKADVYSYAEDDMVIDPYLQQHLMHFGINIFQMEKTEKSMVEMELEYNQQFGEWAVLQESSANLLPIAGPGLTGMTNLGNSCYLNSVMQVMFTVPDFIERYVKKADEIFNASPSDPVNDFNVQMAKLGHGLWSGNYSSIGDSSLDTGANGIKPTMFKNLIGKNHPDFSTKQQQDAQEFLLHLFTVIERNSHGQSNPTDSFKFQIEDRVECLSSNKVKYSYRDEFLLPLPIPLESATNLDDVRKYEEAKVAAEREGRKMPDDSLVRPKLSLKSCLEKFAEPEKVEQFYSTALNDKTTASKRARLSTMPDYLILHLKKFTLREDWTSVKLDVSVDCPDELDISFLRGTGLLPNEEELPEMKNRPPSPQMDAEVLLSLQDMGFPLDACKKAVFFTKNTGLENATNWIMQHITDDDFSLPFVPPGHENVQKEFIPDEEGLAMILSMGFTMKQATKALKATNNNTERAVDYIFSHKDEIDMEDEESPASSSAAPNTKQYRDGDGKYRLKAFISHMGSSSQVGHYVCHILKDDQWIIFNDNKVQISQRPPKDLGYLYLYERIKN